MALSTTTRSNIADADGVTTNFPFTFFAYTTDTIKVYSVLNDELTEITTGLTKTINSSFIGGNVAISPAPADAVGQILVRREVPYTQTTELQDLTRYKESAIEQALNTIVLQTQQLAEELQRCLKYSEAATVTDAIIETPTADDRLLVTDGTDGRIKVGSATIDVDTVAANIASINAVAGAIGSINTVAGIDSDVTAVAGIAANVTAVAAITASITAVAGIAADVTAVGNNITDVSTVATNISSVIDAANNIPKANLTATTAPTVNDDDGDGYQAGSLWVDTVADAVYVCTDAATGAAAWTDVAGILDSTVNAIGSIGGGTQDIDLDLGRTITATVDTSTTTFTFSNPLATGNADAFVLKLTNGGSQTVNWPASVDWAGGSAPTLTASGVDLLVFYTDDGGTIWFGTVVGLDFK